MADPDRGMTFGEALFDLYLQAGQPSSREVAARVDGGISHSTVNQAIRGASVPSWRIAEKIVVALGGDTVEFRKLWQAMQSPVTAAPAGWAPRDVEALDLGDLILVDGKWTAITAIGTDAGGTHVHVGKIHLTFVPRTKVMVKAN